jgi:dsRNA-specific ribonuclease
MHLSLTCASSTSDIWVNIVQAFRSSLVNSTVQSSLAMELGLDKYIKCGQREVSNLLVKIQSHATIKPSKTSFKALKVLNSLSIMC